MYFGSPSSGVNVTIVPDTLKVPSSVRSNVRAFSLPLYFRVNVPLLVMVSEPPSMVSLLPAPSVNVWGTARPRAVAMG